VNVKVYYITHNEWRPCPPHHAQISVLSRQDSRRDTAAHMLLRHTSKWFAAGLILR